ncbi:MAG TPA: SoxR reducing system RseC family protein [Rhodocyclaceae bacterium]|nr:SoxR reducing system RseC family protein [Rhodocyclaceae bacterium]
MAEVEGVVKSVDGRMAQVEVARSSGCGRCHEPGGCGGGEQQVCHRVYRLTNNVGAKAGDEVWVSVAEGSVLKAALLAYGVPGVFMFIGAVVAMALFGGDLATFGGALLGLMFGYALLRIRPAYFGNFQSLSIRLKNSSERKTIA